MKLLKKVKCYDNGGKTLDRYTAVYTFEVEQTYPQKLYAARAMNSKPFHGIGMYCSAALGRHLGKRIKFDELPQDCQKLVMQDLGGYVDQFRKSS